MIKLTSSYFDAEEQEQRKAERRFMASIGPGSHAGSLIDLYRKQELPKAAADKRQTEVNRIKKLLMGD